MEKELMLFFEPEDYQLKVLNLYELVKSDVLVALGSARFEHIGASSVPGSVSKGDLDIFLGVEKEQFNSTIKKLIDIGFEEKKDTLRTNELCMLTTDMYKHDVAIQVVINGSEFESFINFRDFMISRPDLVKELNQIKRDCRGLVPEHYRKIKSEWVEDIIKKYL